MRRVPSFPGFAVTEDGRVFRLADDGSAVRYEAKQRRDSDGYLLVDSCRKVHRLVAEAFVPNPESKPVVRHLNGVRDDNRAENLAWATQAENLADMDAHGTRPRGSSHPTAKLTEELVAFARRIAGIGMSHTELAAALGVDRSVLSRAIKGRTWKHVGA